MLKVGGVDESKIIFPLYYLWMNLVYNNLVTKPLHPARASEKTAKMTEGLDPGTKCEFSIRSALDISTKKFVIGVFSVFYCVYYEM